MFSPAAASFDQFKNFEHRGNCFNNLIKKLIFMNNKSYYDSFIYDWWKNLDKIIFFLFITLIVLGIFFSLVSTSLIASSKLGTNNYYFFLRHLIYVFLGLILIIFFSIIREKDVYRLAIFLFVLNFISFFWFQFLGLRLKVQKDG